LVPVEPPTIRPVMAEHHRMAAIDAASGTRCMWSMTPPTKDGSTRGRPMPSILEDAAVVQSEVSCRHPSRKAEPSGSTTAIFVLWRR